MKKLSFIAMAAAALLATTACNQGGSNDATLDEQLAEGLEKAKTFEDSIIAVNGNFIGGFFNLQLAGAPEGEVDRSEVIRGFRQVMSCDTANQSYLYGIQRGITAFRTYQQIAQSEKVDKARFVEAIVKAMQIDSVTQEQVMAARTQFEAMDEAISKRAADRAKAEAFASKEAEQNRQFAEAYVAKLASNPNFKKVGDKGIYQHVITPAESGKQLTAEDRVQVTYTMRHLDGTVIREMSNPRAMMVAHPANAALTDLLPLMHVGETSEFFVPYQSAYGEMGNEGAGVGLCESILITVTTSEAPAKPAADASAAPTIQIQ
jgi:FKBP-type peptidyl-prolyl cis-trans isomerase